MAWQGSGVSFRENVLLPATNTNSATMEGAMVIKVPDGNVASSAEWTAVPVSALTATGGLDLAGSMKPGMNVLVSLQGNLPLPVISRPRARLIECL